MKKVSRRELARVIVQQLQAAKPAQHAKIMREAAAYLVEHRMVAQADMLIRDIAAELQAVAGHVFAEVTAARDLTAVAQQNIAKYLTKELKASAVELSVQTNPSLIGGVIIKTPDFEYNASVRYKLNQLARGEVR